VLLSTAITPLYEETSFNLNFTPVSVKAHGSSILLKPANRTMGMNDVVLLRSNVGSGRFVGSSLVFYARDTQDDDSDDEGNLSALAVDDVDFYSSDVLSLLLRGRLTSPGVFQVSFLFLRFTNEPACSNLGDIYARRLS
jgi:hypothetical protein